MDNRLAGTPHHLNTISQPGTAGNQGTGEAGDMGSRLQEEQVQGGTTDGACAVGTYAGRDG